MDSKRMLEVLNELITSKTVDECIIKTHDKICQLYKFDRVVCYIHDEKENFYQQMCVFKLNKPPIVGYIEKNMDIEASYYKKSQANSDEMTKILKNQHFIHTTDYLKYKDMLKEVGFVEEFDIAEHCIRCVTSINDGMMGYASFERSFSAEKLNEHEVYELNVMLEVICDKIKNFEAKKRISDERLQYIIDPLTRLMSFDQFKYHANEKLVSGDNYAIMCFDIDKFKYINEIWGYKIGDKILKATGDVIEDFSTTDDLFCRMSDDKFLYLMKYEKRDQVDLKIFEINKLFSKMQKEKFAEIKITVIGGAYMMQKGVEIGLGIDRANIAKLSVKGCYENTCVLYNQNFKNMTDRELHLENRASYALENNEFVPFLQPKFDINTNKICGAEALARWITTDTMISPADFIPIFEKNGFIIKLDFAIYEGTFKFIKYCMDKGYDIYPISLNVSRGHMKDANFCSKFISLLEKYGVPRDVVELEITESVFMADKEVLTVFIERLREEHLMVSIDDFGTAYSSLNLLKDVEVDAIKLDKSLIDNIADVVENQKTEKDEIIIKNIVKMIHELKFKSVFEGIESEEQIKMLKEIGCNCGQGFIFSRPLSLDVFEERYLKK